jgi:hypothetical protein
MTEKLLSTDEGYSISYSGGRLADVIIDGIAVECVQVRDYNFATGKFGRMPSDAQIRARVRKFLNPSDMENYRELAAFYRR